MKGRKMTLGCELMKLGPACHRALLLLLISGVHMWLGGLASAKEIGRKLPAIHVNDEEGARHPLARGKLFVFERELQKRVSAKDGPTEVIAFATSSFGGFLLKPRGAPKHIRELLVISVFGDRGDLQLFTEYGEKRTVRKLSQKEIETVKKFIANNDVDDLPPLESVRDVGGEQHFIVGGVTHVYLHITRSAGQRVSINNPGYTAPGEASTEKYWTIVEFFRQFSKGDQKVRPSSAFRRERTNSEKHRESRKNHAEEGRFPQERA